MDELTLVVLYKNVMELADNMHSIFEGSKEDYFKIAMMAGFRDAYNKGIYHEKSKIHKK